MDFVTNLISETSDRCHITHRFVFGSAAEMPANRFQFTHDFKYILMLKVCQQNLAMEGVIIQIDHNANGNVHI